MHDLRVFFHFVLVAREHPDKYAVVCLDALESSPERSRYALVFDAQRQGS